MSKGVDECRARGCGGFLRGVDSYDIDDGQIAECRRCGREHCFGVLENGGVYVRLVPKPRKPRRAHA